MINQGWINLYKPKNISSFHAINKIKKKFSINKIGHAGTLDPLAEGVLPIALGKATKLIPFITKKSKIYNFTVKWGLQTSTDDSEGEILFKSENIPSLEEIKNKIKNFHGQLMQVPPKISAVKINGQRAYKLDRQKMDFFYYTSYTLQMTMFLCNFFSDCVCLYQNQVYDTREV